MKLKVANLLNSKLDNNHGRYVVTDDNIVDNILETFSQYGTQ